MDFVIFGIAAVVLAVAILVFLRQFWLPARKVDVELGEALRKIRERERDVQETHFTDVKWLSNDVMVTERLSHAWSEFEDTLHVEYGEVDEFGARFPERYRQTVSAELYFSPESLVHAPLNTEFFKHFPGILTASGIIATFTGLILGLVGFGMSESLDQVNANVDNLVDSVWHAFIVSGLLILSAVLATIVEKFQVTKALKLQHELCVELDKLFDAGAGEDYLQQLVDASEISATNSERLKDQLVEKLEELLDAQSDRNEKALNAQANAVGEAVSESIREVLAEPLGTMTKAVQNQSQGAVEGTSRLLENLLSEFTAKLEDTFGSQMRDLNQMMQATSSTLEETTRGLESLIGDIKGAGQETASAMGTEVTSAVDKMAETQRQVNEEATAAMNAMRGQIDAFGESNARVITGVNESVEAMTQASKSTSDQLERSSHGLQTSVDQLSNSAGAIANTTAGLEAASNELGEVGVTLTSALELASRTASDYSDASVKAKDVLTECQAVLDRAKREGEVSEELVAQIEQAAQRIDRATVDLDSYLEGVSQALEGAHRKFAEEIGDTLNKGNQEFHKELSAAVSTLRAGVQEFGSVIEDLAEAAPDRQ